MTPLTVPCIAIVLQLEFEVDAGSPGTGTLQLSGYVRSRALSVNQLVCGISFSAFPVP